MKNISVIIEWENVLLSEMDRCRRMLRELRRQILELNSQISPALVFEVVVVFNLEVVRPELVAGELAQIFLADDPHVERRLTPATGLNYYDLKNFGVQQANGDLIIFLDSDVIPDAGWLKNLLDSFSEPKVQVVAGNSYLDLSNFLGRAMAATWIFPLRSTESALKETRYFFANNVAMRKSTALRFPYPKMHGGATRGSCVQQAENLRDAGIQAHLHCGAQVSHPAPNGWRHLFTRGVAQGRDELLLRRLYRGQSWLGRESYRELRRFFTGMFRGFKSLLRGRKNAHLSASETPLALGVVFVYWHCRIFGAWGTQIFPKFMRNHFRI